jgi:mRNA-degrading endonuclease RelE of RelBE toxin-antitoxin system
VSAWRVVLTSSGRSELRQLAKGLRDEAKRLIRDLAEEPVPSDAVKLRGFGDYYRIRLRHDYRIVYRVRSGQRPISHYALLPAPPICGLH